MFNNTKEYFKLFGTLIKDKKILKLLLFGFKFPMAILKDFKLMSKKQKVVFLAAIIVIGYIGSNQSGSSSSSNFSPGQTYSFAGYPNGCNSDYGCMYQWYIDFKQTKATFYSKKDGDNYKYCRRDVAYIYNKELQTIEFKKVLDEDTDIGNIAGECLRGVLGKWDYRYSDPETRSMPIVQKRKMGLITYDGFYKSSDGSIDSPRFSKR